MNQNAPTNMPTQTASKTDNPKKEKKKQNNNRNRPRIFALDTNVLMHDPKAFEVFDEHTVLVPDQVLNELERHKRGGASINMSAREVTRRLWDLDEKARKQGKGNIFEGIRSRGGGIIKMIVGGEGEPKSSHMGDKKILNTLMAYVKENRLRPMDITVVTKDTLMGFQAERLGFRIEDYYHDKVDGLPPRIPVVELTNTHAEQLARETQFQHGRETRITGIFKQYKYQQPLRKNGIGSEHRPIEPGYIIIAIKNESRKYLGFVDETETVRLIEEHRKICQKYGGNLGISARNLEQRAALDALLNPNKKLVCLLGKAGTGKTLLAIAAGLHLMQQKEPDFGNRMDIKQGDRQEQHRMKLILSRPTISVGEELGFTPGNVDEKLEPWMQPFYDNLEVIVGEEERENLMKRGSIRLQAIAHIRGRSLNDKYLIIDEAQNLEPKEIKAIVTRAGRNTKIVLCGDPSQIDKPYLDTRSNGLSYAARKMEDLALTAVVTLIQGERSELSEAAAMRL